MHISNQTSELSHLFISKKKKEFREAGATTNATWTMKPLITQHELHRRARASGLD
jgi:hypothetical protein